MAQNGRPSHLLTQPPSLSTHWVKIPVHLSSTHIYLWARDAKGDKAQSVLREQVTNSGNQSPRCDGPSAVKKIRIQHRLTVCPHSALLVRMALFGPLLHKRLLIFQKCVCCFPKKVASRVCLCHLLVAYTE